MRNIADIIADDRNGKQLSQTERQVAVAYAQGKYDAVRELKLVNDSNAMNILDKIRAEIEEKYGAYDICEWFNNYDYEENDISEYQFVGKVSDILRIIDKYRKEQTNRR